MQQHEWLPHTRLQVLPPIPVLPAVDQLAEGSWIYPAKPEFFQVCFLFGLLVWGFLKTVAEVLLGARCLSRGASLHTSLTPYHGHDVRSDFSPAPVTPGPGAGAAELSAGQGQLSYPFMHPNILLL